MTRKIGRVIVSVDALTEDSPDLSWDETGDVARGIESGKYVLFCARVRVTFGPYTGDAYLGNCIHRDLADFVSGGGYYRDMVSEAIDDLRNTISHAKATADYWATQVQS